MTSTVPEAEEVAPDAFTRWLQEFPYDSLGSELSGALAECVTATRSFDRKSAFTLSVTVTPGKAGLGEVSVAAGVVVKAARPKTPVMDFFPTEDGSLTRDDPAQPPIPGMERDNNK